MDKKLGIIVPYRRREHQLPIFLRHMTSYLSDKGIRYKIFIIDQDDSKQFNRGMLLNVGFDYAKQNRCDYIVFHDIDMLPIDVDYSYSNVPLHLATDFVEEENEEKREIFPQYFGGVTMFPTDVFQRINGYSNKYWGWGFEDDDLLLRCKVHGINLDTLKIKNQGKTKTKAIKFNGIDSFIKSRNVFDTEFGDLTFSVTFCPDDIICDHTKEVDYYTIFSIPGYDTSISYTSFSRYNFLTFSSNDEVYYLNSEILPNYKTNITVTIDNTHKLITFYQDGKKISSSKISKKLKSYNYVRNFYLGAGNPERKGDERFFKGYLTSFAAFSRVLTKGEIGQISSTENFDSYKGSEDFLIHYDANRIDKYSLTDLASNRFHGKIERCQIVDLEIESHKKVSIPNRRNSLFESLRHEENGFLDNKWRDQATRWNQLRFHNEVSLNPNMIKKDGLSDLSYIEHGRTKVNNTIHVNVGIG